MVYDGEKTNVTYDAKGKEDNYIFQMVLLSGIKTLIQLWEKKMVKFSTSDIGEIAYLKEGWLNEKKEKDESEG